MKDFTKGVLVGVLGVFVAVVTVVSVFGYHGDDYKLFGRNHNGMYY